MIFLINFAFVFLYFLLHFWTCQFLEGSAVAKSIMFLAYPLIKTAVIFFGKNQPTRFWFRNYSGQSRHNRTDTFWATNAPFLQPLGYYFYQISFPIYKLNIARRIYHKLFMKIVLFLAFIIGLASAANWAVIVAGSNTYSNYRHQSDVFHAYQILKRNNFDPEHIITFAYDDIANNSRNPFRGKVFNKPTYKEPGVDVYAGVKIDYSGASVTPTMFQNVLEGNKTKGMGKVLESTSQDNVFLYFADHGAPGLIAFPNQYLHADQLNKTFEKMKGKYNKLVFYLQACESGSMFTHLPNNTKIYALSAANPSESSWGYYCSPDDVVQGKHIGSCLGDLFSINFLEDTDKVNVNKQTLQQQFKVIQKLTTKSHVMQWGDLSFQSDVIGNYVSGSTPSVINLRRRIGRLWKKQLVGSVDSRHVKIQTLTSIFKREKTEESYKEMQEEMKSMQRIDKMFAPYVEAKQLTGAYDPYKIQFECMREVLTSVEERCGRLSDYGLIYVKFIAEGCETMSGQAISGMISC